MYYIEKADKLKLFNKLVKRIVIEENKLILPIEKELNEKQSIKLAEKTNKILQKTNSNKIVISKEVKKNSVYVNMLHSYKYDIVDGKWLFEAISCEVLDFIVQRKQIKKEETAISILVNDLTDYTLENIKRFANEYKTINIVTNHIEKFKKIEDSIYEEQGIMITVTNNKRKSLIKSKIILNIDFPKELLNKYSINDDAIIVNIRGNMKIDKKRFNGIIINDYEISTDVIEKNDKYYVKELYESQFYNGIPDIELRKKIKDDKIEIKELYGINGKIL